MTLTRNSSHSTTDIIASGEDCSFSGNGGETIAEKRKIRRSPIRYTDSIRQGDFDSDTGKYFWCKTARGEYWVTPEVYASMSLKKKAWREKNRDRLNAGFRKSYIENRESRRKAALEYIDKYPERRLFLLARKRSEEQGVPFGIAPGDVKIPALCPVLGIPIRRGKGRICDNSPTLDKIVPSLGYVPGNIIVVSFKANRIKSNASAAELVAVANFYSGLMQ